MTNSTRTFSQTSFELSLSELGGRTVAVTGARGRIGRLLVDALLDAGARVREVDTLPPGSAGGKASHYVRVVLGEQGAYPPEALVESVRGVDAVVHLAALMSWDDRRANEVYRVNVLGTLALLNALEITQAGCEGPRLVLASTGEVYPELSPTYLPIDEAHPTRPTSHYGLSKLMAEEAARFFARRCGAPVVIVRFSHTQQAAELADPESFFSGPRFFVGPRLRRLREVLDSSATPDPRIAAAVACLEAVDRPDVLQLLLPRGADGSPYQMAIADARDIVQGLLLALSHPAAPGEIFNLGPTQAFSFEDVIPYMAERWGLPYVAVNLPLVPYWYETSVEKASKVLGYQPRFTIFDMVDEAAQSFAFRAAPGSC